MLITFPVKHNNFNCLKFDLKSLLNKLPLHIIYQGKKNPFKIIRKGNVRYSFL